MHGSAKVARWIAGVLAKVPAGLRMRLAEINGRAGLVVTTDEGVDSVSSFEMVDGKIAAIRLIRNPDKLRGIAAS